MLVLSRKLNTTIVIDGGIRVTVVDIRGNQVRLGIEAPDQVGIYREELLCAGNRAPEGMRGGAVAVKTAPRRSGAAIDGRETR